MLPFLTTVLPDWSFHRMRVSANWLPTFSTWPWVCYDSTPSFPVASLRFWCSCILSHVVFPKTSAAYICLMVMSGTSMSICLCLMVGHCCSSAYQPGEPVGSWGHRCYPVTVMQMHPAWACWDLPGRAVTSSRKRSISGWWVQPRWILLTDHPKY